MDLFRNFMGLLSALHVRNAATANGCKSSSPAASRTKTSGQNVVIEYAFLTGPPCPTGFQQVDGDKNP